MTAVLGQPDAESHRQIISLSQDSFYRELNEEDLKLAKKGLFNFDHPGTNNAIKKIVVKFVSNKLAYRPEIAFIF